MLFVTHVFLLVLSFFLLCHPNVDNFHAIDSITILLTVFCYVSHFLIKKVSVLISVVQVLEVFLQLGSRIKMHFFLCAFFQKILFYKCPSNIFDSVDHFDMQKNGSCILKFQKISTVTITV